jgi:hypothetical protein
MAITLVTAPATEEFHRKPVKICQQEVYPRDYRKGGPLWRGLQGGNSQKERPSRKSLQQTLKEGVLTWRQQVANATTASRNRMNISTDDMTMLVHAPKRTKKSGIDKEQASPMVKHGRIEHNQDAEERSKNSEWPWFKGMLADYDTSRQIGNPTSRTIGSQNHKRRSYRCSGKNA